MDSRIYTIILERGCPECAVVFAAADLDAIAGREPAEDEADVRLVVSFTNSTTEDLLALYGATGHRTPVMVASDGIVDGAGAIIDFLKENGLHVR